MQARMHMLGILGGYDLAQFVFAAAKLGLADHLQNGSKTTQALSEATQTHPEFLHRMLRFLASHGIFAEHNGMWELTETAEMLASHTPGSLKHLAEMKGQAYHLACWDQATAAVQTGASGMLLAHGMENFEFLKQHPEQAGKFQKALEGAGYGQAALLMQAFSFQNTEILVDAGSGSGNFLCEILRAYPHIHGIFFDEAYALANAKAVIDSADLRERTACVSGNFFESIPNGDTILLKSILADWDDTQARRILQNARRALPAHGGTLLALEFIMPFPAQNTFHPAIELDAMFMVKERGRVRTADEFSNIFENAGFRLTLQTPNPMGPSILIAQPA